MCAEIIVANDVFFFAHTTGSESVPTLAPVINFVSDGRTPINSDCQRDSSDFWWGLR